MILQVIEKVSRLLCRLTIYICLGMIYVMLALLAAQVLLRYFFGSPPSWTEEVAIILFTWVVLLYATVGVRQKFHVAIEFVPQHMTTLRRLSDRLVSLLIGGFGFLLLTAGWSYVERTSGQNTAALQLPIEVLYLSIPVCGALLLVHAAALIIDPKIHDEKTAP